MPQRPLVGRDFELTVLERTLDGLVEGRGVIVSIIGEPGIGKSRLVAEVRKPLSRPGPLRRGPRVSYAQNFPYWPIRDLLREWLGVGASTPEARVRLELKAELAGSSTTPRTPTRSSRACSASRSSRTRPSGSGS